MIENGKYNKQNEDSLRSLANKCWGKLVRGSFDFRATSRERLVLSKHMLPLQT